MKKYQDAVAAYSDAVRFLRGQKDVSPEEYNRLWEIADAALSGCEVAQHKVNHHIMTHQCQGDPVPLKTPA